VGDATEVIPELTRQIEEYRASEQGGTRG